LSLAACTSPSPPPVVPSPTAAHACAPTVSDDELPVWARSGFSGDVHIPHVLGERGDIVAVLFGYPLTQPPREGVSNKILWVSREPVTPGDTLRIEARLDATGAPVSRGVAGGPGPSIVDLPQAGCWRLALNWSGRIDSVDLRYVSR
jgi:hypothetical protein